MLLGRKSSHSNPLYCLALLPKNYEFAEPLFNNISQEFFIVLFLEVFLRFCGITLWAWLLFWVTSKVAAKKYTIFVTPVYFARSLWPFHFSCHIWTHASYVNDVHGAFFTLKRLNINFLPLTRHIHLPPPWKWKISIHTANEWVWKGLKSLTSCLLTIVCDCN